MTLLFAFLLITYTLGMMAIGVVIGFYWFRRNYMELLDGRMDEIVNEVNQML